jgi:ketosteroid isomerase-like protein
MHDPVRTSLAPDSAREAHTGPVPTDSAEIARSAMEAFNRRDYDAGLILFDPAVVWTVGAELQPDAGEYAGREGVRQFWDSWHDTFEDFELVIEECTEAPQGHAVAITRSRGRGAGSGASAVSARFVQLFRIRDGLITHVWLHGRRKTALKAAGLDEG